MKYAAAVLLALALWCAPPATADLVETAYLGDSYTSGAGSTHSALRFATLVSKKMGWDEHLFSHGGVGYLHGEPNFRVLADELAKSHPDVVVVSGGLNDATATDYDSNAERTSVADVFHALRAQLPNARIIAVGPVSPFGITAEIAQIDAYVQTAASKIGAQYISLMAPPLIQPNMIAADGVHVNDAGHAAIADRISSAL